MQHHNYHALYGQKSIIYSLMKSPRNLGKLYLMSKFNVMVCKLHTNKSLNSIYYSTFVKEWISREEKHSQEGAGKVAQNASTKNYYKMFILYFFFHLCIPTLNITHPLSQISIPGPSY